MRDFPIDRIMTPDPATVGPLDSVIHARRLLDTNFIHHLPVVEGGRLVGIVSSSDLLKLHLLDDHLSIYERVTVDQVMETNVVVIEKSARIEVAHVNHSFYPSSSARMALARWMSRCCLDLSPAHSSKSTSPPRCVK